MTRSTYTVSSGGTDLVPILGVDVSSRMIASLFPIVFILPVIASPMPLQAQPPGLSATSARLYGAEGKPLCAHLKQQATDCWLVAAMCAIIHLDNGWLESKIRITARDIAGSASAAEFDTYNPDGGKFTRVVTYPEVWSSPTDRQGEAWFVGWPGGIDIAAIAMGGTWLKNGQIGGAPAHAGLTLLTGYAGKDEGIVDRNTTLALLRKADVHPIILGTNQKKLRLSPGHTYTVLSVIGTRVYLWNPLGNWFEDYEIDEIYPEINTIAHLTA